MGIYSQQARSGSRWKITQGNSVKYQGWVEGRGVWLDIRVGTNSPQTGLAGFSAKIGWLDEPREEPRRRPTWKEGSEEADWSLVKGRALVRRKGDSELWGAMGKEGEVESKRQGDWLDRGDHMDTQRLHYQASQWEMGGGASEIRSGNPGVGQRTYDSNSKVRSLSYIFPVFCTPWLTGSHLGDAHCPLPSTLGCSAGVILWKVTYFLFPINCTYWPLSRPFSLHVCQLFITR